MEKSKRGRRLKQTLEIALNRVLTSDNTNQNNESGEKQEERFQEFRTCFESLGVDDETFWSELYSQFSSEVKRCVMEEFDQIVLETDLGSSLVQLETLMENQPELLPGKRCHLDEPSPKFKMQNLLQKRKKRKIEHLTSLLTKIEEQNKIMESNIKEDNEKLRVMSDSVIACTNKIQSIN
eukprot:c9295_g1_i2.p1 GENE.c9295_g1_i2~~c9295_g1_i2.p1  ORF type:complete len:180 (+),score=61.22 c9295_g1_i2:64-603(+)